MPEYLERADAAGVSLTLPLRAAPYETLRGLPAFFDGLIPEGWLLQFALGVHDLDLRDRFGILMATGRDTVGAVSLESMQCDTA